MIEPVLQKSGRHLPAPVHQSETGGSGIEATTDRHLLHAVAKTISRHVWQLAVFASGDDVDLYGAGSFIGRWIEATGDDQS